MAIKTTRYGTSNEIPPLASPLETGKTVTFPYKASDSQSQMSTAGGVHLMIIEGGRLIFTDDNNTFLPTFNASDITITWKHPFHRVDYKDEVVFIFNAFAKESEGMVHFRYVATGGQTTFSGADADGNTLAYSVADAVQVFKNGAYLPQTDYTATSLTSVVLNSGASVSDTITIWALQNLVDQTDLVTAINSSSASATAAATSATNASNDADDAEKWANHNFNTLFTLSDGVTTGYSAKSRSTDAQRFAEHPVNTTFGITGENTSTHYSAKHYANAASNSATSAGNSATSATNDAATAAAAAVTAQNAIDAFEAVYIGASATDPTTDLNGNALTAGDQYFNTTSNNLYVYTGSAWQIAGNPTNLAGLNDVDNSMSPTSGQVLQYDGTDWDAVTINVTGTLSGMTDTNITSVQDDQVLQYDNASSQWKNETLNLTTTLASLTDTTISSPQNDQILRYDSSDSKWKNEIAGYLTSSNPLASLSDVAMYTASSGDVLVWDGSQWDATSGYLTTAVTSVATGTGLSGGPITSTGTISLADTAVTAASYTNADITVDAQGRITAASNGTSGAITALNNATENEIVTVGSTTTELDAESNLTFDGTFLSVNASSGILLPDGKKLIWGNSVSGASYIEGSKASDYLKFWVSSGSNTSSASLYLYQGEVKLPTAVSLKFEGATSNAYATELTVVDPSANNVITLPNETGTVLTSASQLSTLSDVSYAGPSDGDVLTWDSGNQRWENQTGGGGSLVTLTDTNLNSPTNNQFIRYDSANSQWRNESVTIPSTMTDFTDVNSAMSPSTGDVLYYTGAEWSASGDFLTGNDSIQNLNDVAAMTPSTGDHLYYNGSQWTASTNTLTTASSLDSLSDVSASSPSMDEVLKWNGSNWTSGTAPSGSLPTLTDVAISSPNNEQILQYSSVNSQWENKALSVPIDLITSGSQATLSTSSGYIKLDAHTYLDFESDQDITLDHGGSYYTKFQETGTDYLTLRIDTDVQFKAVQQNSDIKFMGMDDSNEITALTLDMSEEGKALFNHHLVADGNGSSGGVTLQDGKVEIRTGTGSVAQVDFFCESSNLHKVTVKAPPHANFTGDVNFQLPSSEGTTGQVLQTDGSGNTSWTTAGGGASALDGLSDVKYEGTNFDNSLKIGSTTTGTLVGAKRNVFIGKEAGDAVTSAVDNTVLGYQAAKDLTEGSANVIIGNGAGLDGTGTGFKENVLIGMDAGVQGTSGMQGVAIGYEAARGALSGGDRGSKNISIGYRCMYNLQGGGYNVAVGSSAGSQVSTGQYNVLLGNSSGNSITSGSNNVVIGNTLDTSSATVDGEVVIGSDVQRIHINNSGGVQFNSAYRFPTADGSSNQVLQTDGSGTLSFATVSGGGGASALNDLSDVVFDTTNFSNSLMLGDTPTGTLSSADYNTFVGFLTGRGVTSGTYNAALGKGSLGNLTEGDNNVALGQEALSTVSTSSENTGIGKHSMRATNGSYNTGLGADSGYRHSGDGATYIGHSAGKQMYTGNYNTYVGYKAGHGGALWTAIGDLNTALGVEALREVTSGSGNLALGFYSGDGITSGNYNTIIGYAMDPDSATAGGEVVIGTNTRRIHVDNTGGVQFNSAYRFPTADGSTNQVLQTDGAGAVSWATVSGGGGGGVVTAINNATANRLTTIGSTTTELDGEANLTFSSSVLTITSEDTSASAGPFLKLDRQSLSVAAGDEIGEIQFKGHNSFNGNIVYGEMGVRIDDPSATQEQTTMHFSIRYNNAAVRLLELDHQYVSMANEQSLRWTDVTASNYTVTWANATPTASRTITFPDATGTVLTTGNSDTPTTTTSSGDADFVLVDDGGTMKKITPANLGIGGGGASALDGLSDVTISSPQNGQVLKYDGSGWSNGTDATGSGGGGSGVTTGKAIAMAMVFG